MWIDLNREQLCLLVFVVCKNWFNAGYVHIIIYDTIITYMHALLQVEMAGSSIFEYIHSHDHKEVAEQLGLNAPKGSYFASSSSPDSSEDESSSSAPPPPPRSTTPIASERGTALFCNKTFDNYCDF